MRSIFSINPDKNAKLAGLLLALSAATLPACSSEVLPASGSHPMTPPEHVKIYPSEPSKYELVGEVIMPVTADMHFDVRGDSPAGFNALKARVSALGGNGLLLMDKNKRYDTRVGVGYQGTYYLVPMRLNPRTVVCTAIYVDESK